MSKTAHTIYVWTMVTVTVGITVYLFSVGNSYYSTTLEERYYHPQHDWFKPSGLYGHGLGFIGTFLILIGVVTYILHKRFNILGNRIRLKYLLEFHIFLCTVGPIMILFHTAFKFGGIVSIAFWSMVAVVLSGVIGRFIYVQIPRTIEGRAMTLKEVNALKTSAGLRLSAFAGNNPRLQDLMNRFLNSSGESKNDRQKIIGELKSEIKKTELPNEEKKTILKTIREEQTLTNRIGRLELMQRLFKYWHVAHLPFALIMLIIVVIHVGVSLTFGYTWIF